MAGKTIIITGASDGIGREAARGLHRLGHRVVIVGRSPEKTEAVARELQAPHYIADFASLVEVRTLAEQLLRDFPHIDVLCNNAGGLFSQRQITQDGYKMTFQVNHLAPFLLTRLLLDRLIASRASVLYTASGAHRVISLYRPSDPQWAPLPILAYGNSKLMNIYVARELHRRYQAQGLRSASYHPGVVASNFALASSSPVRLMYATELKRLLGMVSNEEGADTLVWLANTQPEQDWPSGGYFIRRQLSPPSPKGQRQDLAEQLWEQSMQMIAPFLDSLTPA